MVKILLLIVIRWCYSKLKHTYCPYLVYWQCMYNTQEQKSSVRFLVARTCTWTTKLLWLTASWISDQECSVIADKDILNLFFWGLIYIWKTKENCKSSLFLCQNYFTLWTESSTIQPQGSDKVNESTSSFRYTNRFLSLRLYSWKAESHGVTFTTYQEKKNWSVKSVFPLTKSAE